MRYYVYASGYVAGSEHCRYKRNPSRSKSSPWACSDMWRKWHPFDALLAERRAILAGERAMLESAEKKDAAWWREVGRG